MYLKITSYSVLIIATLLALYKRKNILKSSEKYFVHYLIFVVAHELIAYIQVSVFGILTYVNYNCFDIITYSYFIYWFYKIIETKKTVVVLGVIYILSSTISLAIEDFFNSYLKINIFAGTIILLLLTFNFYIHYLKKKEVVNFIKNPQFWITTGLLIFNIGYLPILISFQIPGFNLFYTDFGITLLNVLMYGSFIKAFLCYK